MNVFVTGATGYIGSVVVRALARAGHEVSGLVRAESKATKTKGFPASVRWVEGDLKEPRSYAKEVERADASLHLGFEMSAAAASVDATAVDGLLAAIRPARSPRTLVYTSGVWVLGATGERGADETASTAAPFPLVAWRPAHEKKVLDAASGALATAVLRPGIVVGGRGGIAASFFESATKDGAATHVGDGKNRWAAVHLEDLADLYVRIVELSPSRLAGRPASDRLFHAVDGTAERVSDWARAASEATGKGGKTRSFPVEEARKVMGPFADALCLDQVVKTESCERVLGWRPRRRGFVRNAAELFSEWSKG